MEVPAENKNANHQTMEMNDESVGHEKESFEKRHMVMPDKNDKQKNKHRVKSGNAGGKAVDKTEKVSSKSAKTSKKLPVRYSIFFSN